MHNQIKLFYVTVVIAMGGCVLSPAFGQQVKPDCIDDNRDCMISAAEAYLDALITHDASNVPFAKMARRTEQGAVTAVGEQALRDSTKLQPDMTEHANTRYFVDEQTNNVVVYTLLRIPGTKADPNRKSYSDGREPSPSTAHLAERFKVEKGLITEIEALFWIEDGTDQGVSNWPD